MVDDGRRGVPLLRHGTGLFILYGIVLGFRAHHSIYLLWTLTIERGMVAIGNLGPDWGNVHA